MKQKLSMPCRRDDNHSLFIGHKLVAYINAAGMVHIIGEKPMIFKDIKAGKEWVQNRLGVTEV